MKLRDYLDIENLDDLIRNGYVSMRPHKVYSEYNILNYTPLAAHTFAEDQWSDALIKSRGLIIRGDDRFADVVAFGLHKFFNVAEDAVIEGKVWAFDKLDGSLGIVYRTPDDTIQIATRGSFHSGQADWANAFLARNPEYVEYFDRVLHAFPDATPHVEIIYKDNQIVLDYDFEDLVYLGYQTPDFWRPGHNGYPGRRAENYSFDSFADLVATVRPNREGFVIQDVHTMKLSKYKYEKYLELHRAVSNLSPKSIWEQMEANAVDQFLMALPNEFQAEAGRMWEDLEEKRKSLDSRVRRGYEYLLGRMTDRSSKAEYAKVVKQYADRSISHLLFALFDKNESKYNNGLMRMIKP